MRALTQHSSRRIYLAQMNPPFIIYSLYSSNQARTRMKQCDAAAKVNQNWKLFCSISDPVLYQNWISNCQMSIETIKQGSGQQAAVQCPGRGAAAVQRRVTTGKSAQVGCWLVQCCCCWWCAHILCHILCPARHMLPSQLLHRPGHSLHTRMFNVVDTNIEYILYLN